MTKTSSFTNTSVVDKAKTTTQKRKGDPREDGALIGNNSRSQTPPFLLTFEIFNHNVATVLLTLGLRQM